MVCALYIPEVQFANVSTMEPIVLQSVPHDRYNKVELSVLSSVSGVFALQLLGFHNLSLHFLARSSVHTCMQ